MLRHRAALGLWHMTTAVTSTKPEKALLVEAEAIRTDMEELDAPPPDDGQRHLLMVAEALEEEVAWHSPVRFQTAVRLARTMLAGRAAAAGEHLLYTQGSEYNELYQFALQAEDPPALLIEGTAYDWTGRGGTAVWRAHHRVELQDLEEWLVNRQETDTTERVMPRPGWLLRTPATWLAPPPSLPKGHPPPASLYDYSGRPGPAVAATPVGRLLHHCPSLARPRPDPRPVAMRPSHRTRSDRRPSAAPYPSARPRSTIRCPAAVHRSSAPRPGRGAGRMVGMQPLPAADRDDYNDPFAGIGDLVLAVADGRRRVLAVAGENDDDDETGTVALFDVAGHPRRRWLLHSDHEVHAMAFHPTLPLLAVGSGRYDGGYHFEGELVLVDLDTGIARSLIEHWIGRQVLGLEWLNGQDLRVLMAPVDDWKDPKAHREGHTALVSRSDWSTVGAKSLTSGDLAGPRTAMPRPDSREAARRTVAALTAPHRRRHDTNETHR